MPRDSEELSILAQEVAALLRQSGRQLVLAESCTAGLVAAALGGVPGASQNLCGSAVVYQERTKSAWLGVPETLLAAKGAVSPDVASAMAAGALERTSFADVAAAITGHLGPNAPAGFDGVAFVAIQFRGCQAEIEEIRLDQTEEDDERTRRARRQAAAAAILLRCVRRSLEDLAGQVGQ